MRHTNPIEHLRSHFSERFLEQLRGTALSAAGFSAGVIVLLTQIKGQSSYSELSLWAAIFSLLIWLCAWQYVQPYLAHGERTYSHFNFYTASILSSTGIVTLLVSIAAIIWHLSAWAGIAFVVLIIPCIVWVMRHIRAVENYCNEADA